MMKPDVSRCKKVKLKYVSNDEMNLKSFGILNNLDG